MDENICTKYKEKFKNDTGLKCAVCDNIFHVKCADVTIKEFNVIKNLQGLKWFCEGCLPLWKLCMNITKEFSVLKSDLKNEIKEIKAKLDIYSKSRQ